MGRTAYPPVVKTWTRALMHCCFVIITYTMVGMFTTSVQKARRGKVLRTNLNDPVYIPMLRQAGMRNLEIHQRILDWQPGETFFANSLRPFARGLNKYF